MTYSILFSSHKLLKVLYIIVILAVAYALIPSKPGHSWFRSIERRLRRIAAHPWRAILAAAVFPLLVRVCMLPWYPPPPPQIHDEFSYLLQGDTFAHGRVSNPTPPSWQHFETEYTLFRHSYASQYEPAQGVVLALGEVVFSHPWWGVWLSVGVMCGALCWALAQMLPLTWAFAGAVGAALQFGIFGLWMNSYFGGAVAAAAGALVVGSLARLRKRPREAWPSALCAAGIVVTFGSRPFEALLWTCIAVAFILFYAFRAKLWSPKNFALNVLLPFALVFLCGAGLLAWYNWRITGNPADPPYLAYQRIYGTPQPFWWQPPVVASRFDYPEIRDNYLNQVNLYNARYSLASMLTAERNRLSNFWRFFVGPFFTPALLFLPWIFRDRRIRPWLLASIPFIADKASYHAWYPAHSAPETVLILLVLIQSWRHMRAVFRRRAIGVAASRTLVAAVCLTIVLGNIGRAAEPLLLRHGLIHLPPIWESLYPAKRLRDFVSERLERIPGKHLLFVKYAPGHCFCEEWVFNQAELSEQRIVYARQYTPESDQALAQSFAGRDVWLVEPDAQPYRLIQLRSDTEWAAAERGPESVPPEGMANNSWTENNEHKSQATAAVSEVRSRRPSQIRRKHPRLDRSLTAASN